MQVTSDLAGIDGLALVGERGFAGDDKAARQRSGEIGCQSVGNSVDKIILSRIAAEVDEWQDDD